MSSGGKHLTCFLEPISTQEEDKPSQTPDTDIWFERVVIIESRCRSFKTKVRRLRTQVLKGKIMSDDLFEKTKKLLENIGIPSQPRVLIAIDKETQKEDPNFSVIAGLISQDVAMSAKVLKVCNSPYFGLRHKADTVNKALSVLGLKNFKNVILASALRDTMKSRNMRERDFEYFCDHSLFVAKIAQTIAQRLPDDIKSQIDPNHAYMLGLFHDSAVPLLTNKFKDYFNQVIKGINSGVAMIHIEEELFHSNHCIAGYFIAKSWHMPDNLCDAIQSHHTQDIRSVENLATRRLLAVLVLAEALIYYKDKNMSDAFDIFNQNVSEQNMDNIMFEIGFDRDDISDLEEPVAEILDKVANF